MAPRAFDERDDAVACLRTAITFDLIEKELRIKLRQLRASVLCFSGDAPALETYLADVVTPALRILGQFCTVIDVEDVKGNIPKPGAT